MAMALSPVLQLKPLFKPRDFIRERPGSTSLLTCLALFAVIGAANAIATVSEASTGWEDFAAVCLLMAIVSAITVIGMCIVAFLASTIGRSMGGELRRNASVRSALAWGGLPLLWSALVGMGLLMLYWQSENPLYAQAGAALISLACVWSIVVTVAMLTEVFQFGWLRALSTYVLAIAISGLVLAVPIRAFLYQPFHIASQAQLPTLMAGDHVLVSKFAYGYSRFSLPFNLPLFDSRIVPREPDRGDIVVFKLPKDHKTDYVKRVIGLPGDTIELRSGVLHINGNTVSRQRVGDYERRVDKTSKRVPQYLEILPNGVAYHILESDPDGLFDTVGPYKIPAGHYFMLGDNRDNSIDSRSDSVGTVPFENLVGRVEIIHLSVSSNNESRAGRVLKPVSQVKS